MTIPIVPGPFSFLSNLGQAAENYAGGRDKFKQEAWDRLQFLFKGIQTGDVAPSVVKSPLFQSLLKDSGLHDFNPADVTPAPLSQLRTAQAGEIEAALPGLTPAGRRTLAATGQLPTASAEAKEGADTRAQSIRGQVLGQELTPEQQAAVAGVPSGTTAQAGAQGAQDPVLLGSAYRVVTDLINKNGGKVPTPQEAHEYGRTQDIRARAFGDQLNEPYYGAAIQQYLDEQRKLKAQEEAARARAAASLDVVQKNLTPQMQALQDRIDARIKANQSLQSSLSPLAKYGQPSDADKAILAQITQNNQANDRDNADIENYRRQAQQVIAPRVTAQGGAPEGNIAKRRQAWDRAAAFIRQHPERYGYGPRQTITDEMIGNKIGEARP
jgi:hypothetical protein